MGAINVLSKQVAELIAAGEVIERPSSVIKELVENSIDAHATAITVEIKNGGITFMRVSDNGNGIMREDVKNAFLRHATSKIARQDDLDNIMTLGFRGEALASICAVSKVELMTKHISEQDGTCYELEGGVEKTFDTVGCPQGTTFVIRDLFYNVPARMKFLKKDVAESNAIASLMDRIALSHPEISFTFIRDGKRTLKTAGDDRLDNAIFQVFGKQFYAGLIPVSYEYNGVKLSGYVSKPVSANRASRSMQIFFVNGRYVRTKTAMAALEQAYKGLIMTGKFPACVINLEVNCSTLDVNVHPAKLEIRFTNERPIYDSVYYAVKSAVSEFDTRHYPENHLDFPSTNPKVLGSVADRGTQLGFAYGKSPKTESDNEPTIYMPEPINYHSRAMVEDAAGVASAYYQSNKTIKSINLAEYLKDEEKKNTDALSMPHSSSPLLPFSDTPKEEKCPTPPVSVNTFPAGIPKEPVLYDEKKIPSEHPGTPMRETPTETEEAKQASTESEMIRQECRSSQETSEETIAIVDADKRGFPSRYIGEAFSTYIIVEYSDDRLMFIDKHAAHERLIYERLKREHTVSTPQMLLEPVTVTLDKTECEIVLENKEMLMEAGFSVDEFGSGTIIIRSVPIMLEKMEIAEEFMEIADYLVKHRKLVLSEKMEWLYQNTACRAAVKAGNLNHPQELIDLALTLEQNPDVKYCPHGRPIYFFLSKHEIEKNFKRV